MPFISFQQGVALAFGAYIDPENASNNKTFTLVEQNSARNVNGVFAINIRTLQVDTRLGALFHYRAANASDAGQLDFVSNSAGSDLGNLPSQVYAITATSTAVNDADLTGRDDVFTGYNDSEKQLDYRAGGDISGNNSVVKIERNYHRTGLAIWNKLKK